MLGMMEKEFAIQDALRFYKQVTEVYDTLKLQLDSLRLFADALGFDWDKSDYKGIAKGFYNKDHGFVSFTNMLQLHNTSSVRVANGEVTPSMGLICYTPLRFDEESWYKAWDSKLVVAAKIQVLRKKKKVKFNMNNPFKVQNHMVKLINKARGEK